MKKAVKLCLLVGIFVTINFFSVSLGVITEEVDGTNETINCNANVDVCNIRCQGDEKCGSDDDAPLGSGNEIHCPTGDNCDTCYLQCQGKGSCAGRTIYGHNCAMLSIDLRGPRSGKRLRIHAPENNGSLEMNVITGPDCSYESEILSYDGTNEMTINCREGSANSNANNGQCSKMKIDSRFAKHSRFNCMDRGDCGHVKYYCPRTSSSNWYHKYGVPGCSLNCTNSYDCDMDIYINDNTYEDEIDITCKNSNNNNNNDTTEIQIHCDENYELYCNYTLNGDYDETDENSRDWYCLGECQPFPMPTMYPTLIPSIEPSEPSMEPSISPTMVPSCDPTFENSDNSGNSGNSDTDDDTVSSTTGMWMDGNYTDVFDEDELIDVSSDKLTWMDKLLTILINPWVYIPILLLFLCCCVGGSQNMYFNCKRKVNDVMEISRPQLVDEQSNDIVIFE